MLPFGVIMQLDKEISEIFGINIEATEEQQVKLVDLIDKCVALRTVNLLNEFLDVDPRTVNSFVSINVICDPSLGDTSLMVSKFDKVYALNVLGIVQGIIGQKYLIKPVAHPLVGINNPTSISHFEIVQANTRDTNDDN